MKSVFFYRKLSVDYESWAIDPEIWIVYDAAKEKSNEFERVWS